MKNTRNWNLQSNVAGLQGLYLHTEEFAGIDKPGNNVS